MQGTIISSGFKYTPEEIAELKAQGLREGIDFVVADPDAPDFLPGETWSEYGARCYGGKPKPQGPCPPQLLRKRHRK